MRPNVRLFGCCLALVALAGWPNGRAMQADTPVHVPGTNVVRLDPALDAVIAPGTQIERVVTGFKFTEGPMWHDGQLWFSDLVGDKMLSVTAGGAVRVLIDHSGGVKGPPPGSYLGSNAMVTTPEGSVLMIQQGGRRIVRLDSKLNMVPFLDRFEGKRFNSPNDLVYAPDGSLWFTDPPFGLLGLDKDPAKELSFNGVYRYANGKLTAPIRDLTLPNGIGFSADGKTLYISNSGPSMFVEKYHVEPDGSVSGGTKLISYPGTAPDVPDGLKLDSAGNLWTSGPGGFRIISPAGKVLGQVKLPEIAANLAWGEGGRFAYFTASTSIYRLKVTIPGRMPLYSR